MPSSVHAEGESAPVDGTEASQAVLQDAQGFWTSLQAAMSLQQLGHTHNEVVHGMPVDPQGAEVIRAQARAAR